MELTKNLLTELQNRLKVGNRRGVHLNAIPAGSRYKLDLKRLSHIDNDLPNIFINDLLTKQPLNFKISVNNKTPDLDKEQKKVQERMAVIQRSFENLFNQTEAIESEKGINTFGFGFPVLIRRDKLDDKLTVAPILIWSMRIVRLNGNNRWEIQRDEDDPIYINEVLINHLQNDSKIDLEQISSEMLDDGLIDKKELIDILVYIIESINNNKQKDIAHTYTDNIENIVSILDKKHYENVTKKTTDAFIDFGGLFSIFKVQKQSIIKDYENLLNKKKVFLELEEMERQTFQSISSVETDPSQQSILNSLDKTRNILIQGPPGTGKSQSLTAVLINALENHRKTIVVCEKQTALEVLHNVLNNKGLGYQCVLLKDTVKDRKVAVKSVRDRLENPEYQNQDFTYSKQPLEVIINKLKTLIDSINTRHKKLGEELFDKSTWPDTVGKLLSVKKNVDEDYGLDFGSRQFAFNSDELNELLDILQKGQLLYNDYSPFREKAFINHKKLIGDNPYTVEQQIEKDFVEYEESFNGKESQIKQILQKNINNPDLFDPIRTSSFFYKVLALFSSEKKQTLKDYKLLSFLCSKLADKIIADGWSKLPFKKDNNNDIIESTRLLLDSKKVYYSNEKDIFPIEFSWFQYYNNLSEENQLLIDSINQKKNWTKVFLINYLNSALFKAANAELPVNDNDHQQLLGSFKGIEDEQINYIKEYWLAKQIDVVREFEVLNKNLSVENLYNKRSSRKHSRLTLRQIVKFDIELFTTFFPIILTTPDVCSNLFSECNEYFDIVMFDEASQLRLEDNLPALTKGKQIIVAGDEHQMPPSNYFSKIFDGDVDNEDDIEDDGEINIDRDNILLSCESLLDFGNDLSFSKKHLDFHYRSKHPYLIDFSNSAFYNNRLKPLPNKFNYTPINYVQVGGVYESQNNEAEANAIISILENNINRLPNGSYPSIGIATFNISQRDLIKRKIIEMRRKEEYSEFNEKVLELENCGMFVKNLENIQGDERDVIILSTTYGLNSEGKFENRFGPINYKKGYKLLNVIITRAKYKIYVCTSVPEQVFLNYNEHLIAEQSNNRRGVFFAYLAYAKAVSDHDDKLKSAVLDSLMKNADKSSSNDFLNEEIESPFEDVVYSRLVDKFGVEKLTSNFRFAGFTLGIVYDPKKAGLHKVAIECDSSPYHLSKEAYLFDHHKQKILEANGFVFHRVWSTNWWRNPEREEVNLFKFINEVESSKPSQIKSEPNVAGAFTDNLNLNNSSHEYSAPELENEIVG